MSKKLFSLFLALLLIFAASSALGETEPAVITDMMGRPITLSEPATRIVVLTPSDCEILCALGCGETLVGRGAYCDYPESILSVPVVESGADTNIEQIIALQPQVVLMADMSHTVEQVEALEAAGIQVVVSNANSIAETYTAIHMIGQLMGRDAEAEALISDMLSAFDSIAAQCEKGGKTVYFEVSPLEWGLWTAGSGTFMDELANICGLTNAFADVEGWAAISEEMVLERNPDYIVTITMYYGEGPTPVEEIKARSGWQELRAVVDDAILNADSNVVSRPGPRLKDAAVELFDFLSNH